MEHSGLMMNRASMRGALCGVALVLSQAVWAQAPSAPQIYTCIDANGKKLTSDRPIAACTEREQRVLNADGSVRRVVLPTPTADERAAREAREREAAAEHAAIQDAIRRDRNLRARFPDEATHQKAREAALDDIRKAMKASEDRVALLAKERKPLLDETEFYVGKALPAKLRAQLDANDASAGAQRSLIQTQQAEIVRINALYDAELDRLRKLWSGAQPGSMGVLPGATAAHNKVGRK
ncbi:MAG: DUF4124 domain-containing protein [Burkholderiaceae bacterium]